ncbi:MAG TPA: thiamine pyrophosphate-binding protein [Tepidisphaeraceae bacterium]|nr:thiamine pyrophosphate-binding protein [Tepidisphaeraceae bacterium]
MRIADYIAQTLADRGIRHVFMVTGGAAMFLNHAFGSEPRLEIVCNHHEQACAMAADGYFRASGKMAAVNVTAGPGAINALNGVFGAWTDSIPMLVVSGQVKRQTCMATYDLTNLRQLGDQEVDIIRMVRGITKYAACLTDPATAPYHLRRAIHLATTGRFGPCWLDVPIDIQSAQLPTANLTVYDPGEDTIHFGPTRIDECLWRIADAKRPVILAGSGIRLSGAVDLFHQAIAKLAIPVATAWTHDIIATDDPLFCGRQGTIGQRAGNFTVQNADLLLILGARLPIRQISYNWESFAPKAYKIWVDIDEAELNKPTVKPDLPIHCDVKDFLRDIIAAPYSPGRHADWLAWCKDRQGRYPPVLPHQRKWNGAINPYHFMETLFGNLADDDMVVCGDATACIVPFQTARLRLDQRLFSNSGAASMGWDLPAAIGAAIARGGKRIICLAGDGSVQMNMQELQTLVHHHLPVKIFILGNGGYLSIRTTQNNFFGKQTGSGPDSGVTTPDMTKIAAAYDIPRLKIDRPDFAPLIRQVLATEGPFLTDVVLDQSQTFEPRLSSRQLPDGRMETAPLEDMFPFLDRDELKENMLE